MAAKGAEAEEQAVALLRAAGARIITRNYRCRLGEIDIIAREGPSLLFVEVRLRSHPGYAGAAASVGPRKQRRLIRAAQHFLQRYPRWRELPCRFDVIAFEPPQSAGEDGANWIRGAFSTTGQV
jgi:putative endonuclease